MNSSWRSEWYALAAQIGGLLEAARTYYASRREQDDPTAIRSVLVPHSRRIYDELKDYHDRVQDALPDEAQRRLLAFLTERAGLFAPNETEGCVQFRLTALASLRAEVDYLLSDFRAHARRMSERAFLHLQRSIVVDETARGKWVEAFKQGEVACERLGAIHLLQHGIWAFKVNATGERTDLVFQDPLSDLREVDRAAEALVLTEWKVVQSPGDLAAKIAEAKDQVGRYRSGSLAGIELTDYRYLVMVSHNVLKLPPDQEEQGVVYRHIGIAVKPSPPSRG